MKIVLGPLSAAVAAFVVIVALSLATIDSNGGVVPSLRFAVSIGVLAVGNILTFALNGLYWALYGAPRWLRIVIILQAVTAVVSLLVIGLGIYGELHEAIAFMQCGINWLAA